MLQHVLVCKHPGVLDNSLMPTPKSEKKATNLKKKLFLGVTQIKEKKQIRMGKKRKNWKESPAQPALKGKCVGWG